MAKKSIDHKERKREIQAASLRLFAKHGYAEVNFGMIAGECGIARTLLYSYFKNKRAIFNGAIGEATSKIEARYREIMRSRLSADAKLRQVCVCVFALLFDNRDFLCVIVDFLCSLRRAGRLLVKNVARHTVGLRRIMHTLVVEAVHRGEYDRSVEPERVTALLYSQFEAVALKIAVTGNAEISEAVDQLNSILLALRAPSAGRQG